MIRWSKANVSTESELRNAGLDMLRTAGVFAFVVFQPVRKGGRHDFHRTSKGVADILGVFEGRPIAVEVKTKTGVVAEHQLVWLAAFRVAGGLSFVARSLDDFETIIKKVTGRNHGKKNLCSGCVWETKQT